MLVGIVSDVSKKNVVSFFELILVKYNFIDLNASPQRVKDVDVILVLGGDGFFLHSVHKFLMYNKPYFGINYGTVGFLLNDVMDANDVLHKIQNAKETRLNLLKAEIETKTKTFKSLSMNEVTLFRASGQIAKIKVFVDEVLRIKELASDGVVLSTAAGSTAYNFSLHGPIFSPDSKVLSLCPISPFRPRHFRGAMLLDSAKVRFEVMEAEKRPVLATSDFNHFEDVKSLSVHLSKNHFVRLLFDENKSFNEKILEEQFLM